MQETENLIGTVVSKEENFVIKVTEKSRHRILWIHSLYPGFCFVISVSPVHPQAGLLPLVAAELPAASAVPDPVFLHAQLERVSRLLKR